MNKDFLTVEELNFFINNLFLEEELLHNVPVLGEVSGCSTVGGHCYFTLKDTKAQIKVCFFNYKNNYIPVNGEKVLVRGQVDYYSKNGQLSVKAYKIIPYGRGELHAKLEELKQKLESEGLFREEYKKEIPYRATNIAIITSVKGAAFQDFFTTVRKKNQIINLTVIDVRVQGENCVKDIVTALTNADDYGFDVIILSRGGGSFEDLYSFNDESIVRTIFRMNTPVISAIGHESDYTLCDYVADKRVITPTAAAEAVGFDVGLVKNEILELTDNISSIINFKYDDIIDNIKDNVYELRNKANILYANQKQNVYSKINLLSANFKHFADNKQNKLASYMDKLESLSPLKLLDKGYFRITDKEKMINSIAELELENEVKIIGIDGQATAKIIGKELKQ
jgi:exodeoxyribonuclease VII large subunit